MYPIEDYPYKELADKFGMEVITVQHMVNWIKTKPEVIAYLRSIYSPESLPDLVGDIEGVDYGEFLKSKGVDVPQSPTNNDDVDDDYDDDDGVNVVDGDDVNDDVVEGVPMVNDKRPVQGVGIVANKIEQSAPMSINRQQHAPTNSNQQAPMSNQQPTGINEQQPTPINKQSVVVKPVLKTKLPEPILKPKDAPLPLRVITKQDSGKSADTPSKARVVKLNIVYIMAEKSLDMFLLSFRNIGLYRGGK